MEYNGLIISDIHIGAMNIKDIKFELENSFFSYIKSKFEDTKLDFIIFLGDYFDHKLYMNDENSKYSSKFINDLLEIISTINTNCKIRFIYGTESHECDQYDTIFNNIPSRYDLKVIKHVSDELLFPDMRVLYIPEEHIINKYDYYKDYFENKSYNYIFGHGVIREVMKQAAVINDNIKDSKRRKVPVFSTAELKNVSDRTFFGHYHINVENNNGFFYVGSFSRWKFGEDVPKGFYHISYNPEKDKYKERFIQNDLAKEYKTYTFGYNDNVFTNIETLDKRLTNWIQNIQKSDAYEHVKFRFNIPETCENPESYISYLNERFKYDDHIKVEITHGYIESKKKREKQKIQEGNNKYSILFDKSYPIEDKVSYFISIEYAKELSKEKVDMYLHQPLDSILK